MRPDQSQGYCMVFPGPLWNTKCDLENLPVPFIGMNGTGIGWRDIRAKIFTSLYFTGLRECIVGQGLLSWAQSWGSIHASRWTAMVCTGSFGSINSMHRSLASWSIPPGCTASFSPSVQSIVWGQTNHCVWEVRWLCAGFDIKSFAMSCMWQ